MKGSLNHAAMPVAPGTERFSAGRSGVFLALCLWCGALRVSAQTIALGTTNLLEGPAAGADSVVLAVTLPGQSWTAAANDVWLHLDANNSHGAGSTNVVFSFDANPGATRTGTLTIAGHALTVTQAGATYVAANPVPLVGSGLSNPFGVAVDGAGNVYIADTYNNAIKEWSPATGTVTTLVASGLHYPEGVAVDGAGNVYIANGDNTILKWSAATQTVTTLVGSGLSDPTGVAVDGAGNVYIADTWNGAIKRWSAATQTVTTLVGSGLSDPTGVAVDGAGNVYIADSYHYALKRWTAASQTVTTLVGWLGFPLGVAVDSVGSVYMGGGSAIEELPRAFVDPTARTETPDAGTDVLPAVLATGQNLGGPFAPTSDHPWLTIIGVSNGAVSYSFTANASATTSRVADVTVLGQSFPIYQENTAGFISLLASSALQEAGQAGRDSVSLTVLPATGIWTATANAPWLHFDAANEGDTGSATVSFTFDANPGGTRSGTLTVAGQTLTITQGPPNALLSATTLFEGASAGGDLVIVILTPATAPWVATANASWLHLSPANQSGAGSAAVSFTFDANPGGFRSGTLTIGDQTLTVNQAAASQVGIALGTSTLLEGPAAGADSVVLGVFDPPTTWTATANDPWLHLSPTNSSGTASTNVVFTFDANAGATRTGTITVAGLTLAVTQAGPNYVPANWVAARTYSADSAASPVLIELDAGGWVTVDGAGNLYSIIDDLAISLVNVNDGSSDLLFSTLDAGVAALGTIGVDGAGNVYSCDGNSNAIMKWSVADGSVAALPCSVVPNMNVGFAVDAAGNCYFTGNGSDASVYKRTASDGNVAVLIDYLKNHGDLVRWVAVDGSGNICVGYYYEYGGSLGDDPNAGAYKWSAVDGTLTDVVGDYLTDSGVMDTSGNIGTVYYPYYSSNVLPRAFVDPTGKTAPAAAGSDVLPLVLPATENLTGPFAPASDSAWLTIRGVANGVVSYAFTANTTLATRTGHITLLGQSITITQAGAEAPILASPVWLPGGNLQFTFTGTPGASYSVLFSASLALPLSAWTVAGTATENPPGQFQFAATPSPATPNGFYRVRSP